MVIYPRIFDYKYYVSNKYYSTRDNPLLVFHSTTPTLPASLPALIKLIRLTCCFQLQLITQPPFNHLLHVHSLLDCLSQHANLSSLFSPGLISRFRPCLSRTCSQHLCPGNLTFLLPLIFASVRSLSACCLPGLPLRRHLPHSGHRL